MAYSRSIKHASRIGRNPWNIAMASRRALMDSALRALPVLGSRLLAFGRWCVISGLWTLQALATALAWALGGSQGAALKAAEWASEKRAELKVKADV